MTNESVQTSKRIQQYVHRRKLRHESAEAHGERWAPAYNMELGAETPAGPTGQVPSQGSGAKPPEAESILSFKW